MLLPDPVTGETPDHTIGIYLLSAFGYTEKVPVYEVAPWTVRYLATPPTLTDGKYAAALADVNARARVVVDSLPSGWDPTSIFKVDIEEILGSSLSTTNPLNVRLSDGITDIPFPTALDTGALKVREQNPLTEIDIGNWPSDYPDTGTQKLLGGGLPTVLVSDKLKVRASEIETLLAGGLPANLDTGALRIREQNPLTSISVDNFPTDYPDLAVATLLAGGLPSALDTDALKIREQNWPSNYPDDAVATLLGAGLPADLDTGALKTREQNWPAILSTPSTIGTLSDVTAGTSATQLTASSIPCKAVTVKALAANTGKVRVGENNVSASRGHELDKNQPVDIAIDNVNKVYIFGNGTDKVSVIYVN